MFVLTMLKSWNSLRKDQRWPILDTMVRDETWAFSLTRDELFQITCCVNGRACTHEAHTSNGTECRSNRADLGDIVGSALLVLLIVAVSRVRAPLLMITTQLGHVDPVLHRTFSSSDVEYICLNETTNASTCGRLGLDRVRHT